MLEEIERARLEWLTAAARPQTRPDLTHLLERGRTTGAARGPVIPGRTAAESTHLLGEATASPGAVPTVLGTAALSEAATQVRVPAARFAEAPTELANAPTELRQRHAVGPAPDGCLSAHGSPAGDPANARAGSRRKEVAIVGRNRGRDPRRHGGFHLLAPLLFGGAGAAPANDSARRRGRPPCGDADAEGPAFDSRPGRLEACCPQKNLPPRLRSGLRLQRPSAPHRRRGKRQRRAPSRSRPTRRRRSRIPPIGRRPIHAPSTRPGPREPSSSRS